jgi:hypothetical protein
MREPEPLSKALLSFYSPDSKLFEAVGPGLDPPHVWGARGWGEGLDPVEIPLLVLSD